jgi:hypothetical protein
LRDLPAIKDEALQVQLFDAAHETLFHALPRRVLTRGFDFTVSVSLSDTDGWQR